MSGHPNMEKGRSPEENQVSSTSSSGGGGQDVSTPLLLTKPITTPTLPENNGLPGHLELGHGLPQCLLVVTPTNPKLTIPLLKHNTQTIQEQQHQLMLLRSFMKTTLSKSNWTKRNECEKLLVWCCSSLVRALAAKVNDLCSIPSNPVFRLPLYL